MHNAAELHRTLSDVVACSIIDARNGKIAREHDYYDVMALMSQRGVSD